MTETTIEDNWKDYTSHSCSIEIPQSFGKPPQIIEIRRSMLSDNAFLLVKDGVPEKVIPQMDIWKTIKDISFELFRAFGIYTPEIDWPKRVPKEFRLGIDGDGNIKE
jgi:hypothetical protein